MNVMFSWQKQYFTRSLRSLVRYCSCHSNIKFISSRYRVISSMYFYFLPRFFSWVVCRKKWNFSHYLDESLRSKVVPAVMEPVKFRFFSFWKSPLISPLSRGTLLEELSGMCGPLLKTLTLFIAKICSFPYPIYGEDPKLDTLFMTWPLISCFRPAF